MHHTLTGLTGSRSSRERKVRVSFRGKVPHNYSYLKGNLLEINKGVLNLEVGFRGNQIRDSDLRGYPVFLFGGILKGVGRLVLQKAEGVLYSPHSIKINGVKKTWYW